MGIETTRTSLGKRFSEGARLLWVAKTERGWSQGEVRRAIGAKAGVVPRWLYGDTKPSWDWAVRLRDTLGIPLEAWTVPSTVVFIPPAAREDESGPLPDDVEPTGTDDS